MLSMYAQCTSQFKIGSQLRYFFVKDRIAPEENRLILRILENAISSGKKKTNKKAARVCLKVYRKTHGNT